MQPRIFCQDQERDLNIGEGFEPEPLCLPEEDSCLDNGGDFNVVGEMLQMIHHAVQALKNVQFECSATKGWTAQSATLNGSVPDCGRVYELSPPVLAE